MTTTKLTSMTTKERVALYKSNEKQTIYTGLSGKNEYLQRQRAFVLGNIAVNNLGWIYKLSNESGTHRQGLSANNYPKWNFVTR